VESVSAISTYLPLASTAYCLTIDRNAFAQDSSSIKMGAKRSVRHATRRVRRNA
jgi:hypothetical protein